MTPPRRRRRDALAQSGPVAGRDGLRSELAAWWRTPVRARLYSGAVVLGAVAVTATAARGGASTADLLTVLALIGVAVANGELGRLAEGGRVTIDRPHKGMSAWPFTAALLVAPGFAGVVAAAGYGYARARGIRIPLWKWTFSWGAVTLSALASRLTHEAIAGGHLPPVADGRVLGAVVAAGLVFLAVETALFFGISRINLESDETQLRARLLSPEYYLTELAVLSSAATGAVLWRYWPGFLLLAIPEYVLMQRAILHASLRQEARVDAKTGLLNSGTWNATAETALRRAHRTTQPIAVLLIDLDHFKAVNDNFGHVAGDEVLARTADTLAELVRATDLVGRFGGEEFSVLLVGSPLAEARQIAERIREQLARLAFTKSGLSVTASIGIAVWQPGDEPVGLGGMIEAADRALYEAKSAGRNLVCLAAN